MISNPGKLIRRNWSQVVCAVLEVPRLSKALYRSPDQLRSDLIVAYPRRENVIGYVVSLV